MKKLTMLAALLLGISAHSWALTGDLNRNGVIEHGTTGEYGYAWEGVHCARGLFPWDYTTKVWNGYQAGQSFGAKYMCFASACVPSAKYDANGKPDVIIYRNGYSGWGFGHPCCSGMEILVDVDPGPNTNLVHTCK